MYAYQVYRVMLDLAFSREFGLGGVLAGGAADGAFGRLSVVVCGD